MAGQNRRGRKAAVALGFDPAKDAAPRIIAAGQGDLAEALVRVAKKYQIPIHQDHPLAEALVRLDIGENIPPELYAAVAEVMAFLWRLEAERSGGGGARL